MKSRSKYNIKGNFMELKEIGRIYNNYKNGLKVPYILEIDNNIFE